MWSFGELADLRGVCNTKPISVAEKQPRQRELAANHTMSSLVRAFIAFDGMNSAADYFSLLLPEQFAGVSRKRVIQVWDTGFANCESCPMTARPVLPSSIYDVIEARCELWHIILRVYPCELFSEHIDPDFLNIVAAHRASTYDRDYVVSIFFHRGIHPLACILEGKK